MKLVKFESLGTVSYSPSIVTMALSCIISEIKQVIGQISRFFYIHVYSTPQLVVSHQNIARPFGTEKLEWCDVSNGATFNNHERPLTRVLRLHHNFILKVSENGTR